MPPGKKLRAAPLLSPFHIVLVEPEIPPNTGAIARTCAATKSPLHLVGTLGFRIDEHSVRRAGLDYWHLVDVRRHMSFDEFRTAQPNARIHLFSSNAQRSFLEAPFAPGDALVFGKESTGLDDRILEQYPETTWGIPTMGEVRSLNLANAVAIVLYEAIRRSGGLAHTFMG